MRLVYCCALDGTYTKTFVGRVSTRHVGLTPHSPLARRVREPDLQYRSGGSHKFQIACNTTLAVTGVGEFPWQPHTTGSGLVCQPDRQGSFYPPNFFA